MKRLGLLECAARLTLAVLLAGLHGCASDDYGTVPTLREAIDIYRASDDEKAIAVAADEGGRRVWGVAVGEFEQEAASEKALAHCAKSARSAGVGAQCYLLLVGTGSAKQTDRGCAAGSIPARRCEVQRRFAQ